MAPRVRGISPEGKEKVYRRKDLPNSQVLSLEWKTERVREDASGDSEDGEEDDELPCVIGERAGDCVWLGSRRSVASSFHRHGAAYWKERLVIFKEERVGGGARVTIGKRVLWQSWTEIKSWRYWGWFVVRILWVRERSLYLLVVINTIATIWLEIIMFPKWPNICVKWDVTLYSITLLDKELIRRWDSERELFYDDILHVIQSTIDSCRNSGTDIGHTLFTLNRKQQKTATTVKRNLNDKLQVSNGEIHSTANAWI